MRAGALDQQPDASGQLAAPETVEHSRRSSQCLEDCRARALQAGFCEVDHALLQARQFHRRHLRARWREAQLATVHGGSEPEPETTGVPVLPVRSESIRCQAQGLAVLVDGDTYLPETYAQSEEAREFPPHCERDTPGWDLVVDPGALDPGIDCYTLEKGVFDMWAEPGLRIDQWGSPGSGDRDALFTQLRADGVEDVTVVGVAADYCVRWAVDGLIERGFRVTVPANLTRGIVRQIDAVATEEWTGASVSITGKAR